MISDYDAQKIAKHVIKLWREEIQPDQDKFLSVEEAADYLHISVSSLYKLGERVPRTKVGGKLIYSQSTLNRYIYGRRRK